MDFKGIIILFVVVTVLFQSNPTCYGKERRRSIVSKEEDVELERQLKILNKPPVKTIREKSGEIIDCIDIYKQPAFDHPLLKNHKIQMEPDMPAQGEPINKEFLSVAKASGIELDQPHSARCPTGTVPIRRTKKKDLINAKYLSNFIYNSKYHHAVSIDQSVEGKIYYGGRAFVSTEQPSVQQNQFSTAQIWVQNGPQKEINCIEVGWAVNPSIFGDNKTHSFAHWTADGYQKTGCFNMLCTGFAQIHSHHHIGEILHEISVYGKTTHGIIYIVYRELAKGNWWLIIDGEKIGYWPSELFTHLAGGASSIRYGGVTGANPFSTTRTTPPMGNGHLPIRNEYSKSASMTDLQVVDDKGTLVYFGASKVRVKQNTTMDCYNLLFDDDSSVGAGISMIFGGPGGSCP